MRKFYKFSGCLTTIVVFGILVYAYLSFERSLTEKIVTVKIIEISKNLDGEYLVSTKNEIFINKNNSFHRKINSEQLNELLEKGKTYKLKVVGIRIPLVSKYRNIITIVEEIKPEPDKW